MQIRFTMTEAGAMAMNDEFLRTSPVHQRSRQGVRWLMPVIMLALLAFSTYRKGFSAGIAAWFVGGSVLWFLFYPIRFGARVRRHSLKRMRETSYAKIFGDYEVELLDDGIHITGPTGQSTRNWDSVDRVHLSDDYLLIYFAGASGLPIAVADIGVDQAQEIRSRINSMRESISPHPAA